MRRTRLGRAAMGWCCLTLSLSLRARELTSRGSGEHELVRSFYATRRAACTALSGERRAHAAAADRLRTELCAACAAFAHFPFTGGSFCSALALSYGFDVAEKQATRGSALVAFTSSFFSSLVRSSGTLAHSRASSRVLCLLLLCATARV